MIINRFLIFLLVLLSLYSYKISKNYAKINGKQIITFILLLYLNMAINVNFAFNRIVVLLLG